VHSAKPRIGAFECLEGCKNFADILRGEVAGLGLIALQQSLARLWSEESCLEVLQPLEDQLLECRIGQPCRQPGQPIPQLIVEAILRDDAAKRSRIAQRR
jgi:hypothetical protein